MPDFDVITIDCECCQLRQRLRDRDGAAPTICDTCVPHQGSLPEKEIARARAHEAMVRERLVACRASEARAREVADQAKERVASALRSRGILAARIVSAVADLGSHRCAAADIGRDPKVIELAERHQAHRRREDDDHEWLTQWWGQASGEPPPSTSAQP
jgi:hypothetical protein